VANHHPSVPSPISLKNVRHDRPAQDEWGMFDPKQAGVEALLRKLQARTVDKDTEPELPPVKPVSPKKSA